MTPTAGRFDYDRVAGSVSADLERVLGPAPSQPDASPPRPTAPPVRRKPPADRAAQIGIIFAAGFVGLAAGLALSQATDQKLEPAPPAAARAAMEPSR